MYVITDLHEVILQMFAWIRCVMRSNFFKYQLYFLAMREKVC